jgi:hypothetical protein
MSVAGSGTGLGEGTELTKPNALTENRKECDPGVSPNKKESEPELKLSQLLRPEQGLAKFETRVALSRAKEKEVDEDMNSLWLPSGNVDVLTTELWEKVNGKVTVVAFRLTKFAWPWALAEEFAFEEPGPLAKPVTSAVAPPGGADAAAVARALPLNPCEVDVEPDKKEMLVPNGIGPGAETEAWAKTS